MTKISWWRVPNQSLAVAVRNSGFDLAIYAQYTAAVQKQVKAHACKQAMKMLREDFSRVTKGKQLKTIKTGVYVICVSSPFTIAYHLKPSKVVYIGRGNIHTRIKTHYDIGRASCRARMCQ